MVFRKSGDLQTFRCGSGEPHERGKKMKQLAIQPSPERAQYNSEAVQPLAQAVCISNQP
jgi:hypothetical protein